MSRFNYGAARGVYVKFLLDFILYSVHNLVVMKKFTRKEVRFLDFARFESCDLCALPGVLEDVSKNGCRVEFPVSVEPDMERDYSAVVHFPDRGLKSSLKLMCHPQWLSHEDGKCVVGFSFLRSPDTQRLMNHIDSLSKDASAGSEIESLILDSSAVLV